MLLGIWNTFIYQCVHLSLSPRLSWWLSGKESASIAGGAGATCSIPRSGRSPGGGRGNPLQYSCLQNPKDRGTWNAAVHRVLQSGTWEVTLAHVLIHYTCSFSWQVVIGWTCYFLSLVLNASSFLKRWEPDTSLIVFSFVSFNLM